MKHIYFARHGETNSNKDDLIQGDIDELSVAGHAQAQILAERLRHLDFKNLIVSDYVRTKQTIKPLLAHTTVKPVYSPLARELKRPTEFVGQPRHGDAFLKCESLCNEHMSDPEWHFSDEENYFDIVARVRKLLMMIESLEGDTVVVSHGRFTIFTMMYVIMGGQLTPEVWKADLSTFTSTNTGITVFTYKENKNIWALTTYNDHAHFAE